MLKQAVDCFIEQDADKAWKTMEMEEQANQVRDQINVWLFGLREQDKLPMEALTPLLTIARRFERVSDQCKNICEEVLYLCTGKYMKHLGTEVFRVLFVDDYNSSLSQMAEGISKSLGHANFIFTSAGVNPKPLDSETVQFLQTKGFNIEDQISKSVNQIPNFEHYQVIVALSKAARKVFPGPPTKTVAIVWDVKDPVSNEYQGEDSEESYQAAYSYLDQQIRDLTNALLGQNESDS
jgi:protein-tyrosine-phosphatase